MMKKFLAFKKMWLLSGLGILTTLFSVPTLAANGFFQLAKHDMSVGLLQQLFGYVGSALTAPPALMNTMFKEFNGAIMVLAVFVVVYVLVISIINTAHQGEFLGKKLDSMWVPLRTIAGIAFVAPLPCGYSAIQVIMMWVVVQGIGAADALWSSAVSYISTHNYLGSTATTSKMYHNFSQRSINNVADILAFLTAEHAQYKASHPKATFANDPIIPNITTDVGNTIYTFADIKSGAKGIGGQLILKSKDLSKKNLYEAEVDGMNNMVNTLNITAKKIVYDKFSKDSSGNIDEPNPIVATLSYLNSAYFTAEDNNSKMTPKNDKAFWDKVKATGWITAGAYYYDVAEQNGNLASRSGPLTKLTLGGKEVNGIVMYGSPGDLFNIDGISGAKDNAYIIAITHDADGLSSDNVDAGSSGTVSWAAGAGNDIAKWVIMPALSFVLQGTWKLKDPVICLQHFGSLLVSGIIGLWGFLMVGLTATSAGLSAVSYWAPAVSTLMTVGVMILMPVLAAIIGLFSSGVLMAFYIPMVPFIIFSFAAIGWVIAVFETMLAAPVVAIGLIDPHGQHEVLGRAEPALQLLANVFLRPSLMIFGLLGGMILAKVAIGFVLSGFFYIMIKILISTVVSTNAAALRSVGVLIFTLGAPPGYLITVLAPSIVSFIIGFIILICLLVIIVMAIINRCYSLIHIVPDRILSWLGWQAQFGQYSQMPEQEIKQGFNSASGAASKFAQSFGEGFTNQAKGLVGFAAQRGRQANDWGHDHGLGQLLGMKSQKRSEQIKAESK